MKKLLLLISFIYLSLSAAAQGPNTFGGVALRVNDSTTYVTNAAAHHSAGYSDLWYSNSSNLYWVWDGSQYINWEPGALIPNIQTGNYNLQADDKAKIVYMRHASTPRTATIPAGQKIGATFVIVQDSTATVTVAGAAGVDIIGTATLTPKEVSVWHHRETGKYVRLGSSGGAGTPGGSDTQVQYNDGGSFNGEADMTYNETTNTFTVDNVAVDTEAYDATGWNGDLTVPTKDDVRDKFESLVGVDYSRTAVSNSAGTVAMDWNSLALKNFDLTTTETGNITLSFTNTTNLVQGRLTLRVTGTITVTMPSAVVMDLFEEDMGRWNSSTNVLTLTGVTASPFLLDFYSDGTNIWCHASNRGL